MGTVTPIRPKPETKCNHTDVLDIGDDWLCCCACGEILDPYIILRRFLSAEGYNRKRFHETLRELEETTATVQSQRKDIALGSNKLIAIMSKIQSAKSELNEINETIRQRAPTRDELMKELE